jgi:hypothetical protein
VTNTRTRFIRNKKDKKYGNDKDTGGSGTSKNSSIIEITSQEFSKATEKSSAKNEI